MSRTDIQLYLHYFLCEIRSDPTMSIAGLTNGRFTKSAFFFFFFWGGGGGGALRYFCQTPQDFIQEECLNSDVNYWNVVASPTTTTTTTAAATTTTTN